MLRIKYEDAVKTMERKLIAHGVGAERARLVAETAASISLDGIYSHGINRFKRLILSIDSGICDPLATPSCTAAFGGFERWDGNHGIGIVNAMACTDRAITLARTHGVACVSLRNTNHWFRGGTYGWRIAEAGMIGIVFTNTKSNMVYHGTLDRVLGTTPLVIALPRSEGPVVADVSLGEYSYGKLQLADMAGKQMPKPAGYDSNDQIRTDPMAVMTEARLLPLGEYKGSAINLLLDLIASSTSLGNSACDVRDISGDENAISQTFLAINSRAVNDPKEEEAIANRLLAHLLDARPAIGFPAPRYPGQNVLKTRAENTEQGIPVENSVWQAILELPDAPHSTSGSWL